MENNFCNDELNNRIKTAGIVLIVLGIFNALMAMLIIDMFFIIDASVFLLSGIFTYFRKSKTALIIALISYGIGWLSIFDTFSLFGLILRAAVSYTLIQGFMAAHKLSNKNQGCDASLTY